MNVLPYLDILRPIYNEAPEVHDEISFDEFVEEVGYALEFPHYIAEEAA